MHFSDKLTMWGMSPVELHDQFWAGRGIQVVRPCTELRLAPGIDAYLLLDAIKLFLFNPAPALSRIHWINPLLLTIRVRAGLRWICSGPELESGGKCSLMIPHRDISAGPNSRAVMTTARDIAVAWSSSLDIRSTWRSIRRMVPQDRRAVCCLKGVVAAGRAEDELSMWMGHLASAWRRPDHKLDNCQRVSRLVYKDMRSRLSTRARSDVPMWIGYGRESVPSRSKGGPILLWDAGVLATPAVRSSSLPAIPGTKLIGEPR